jgi:hypothetical protein
MNTLAVVLWTMLNVLGSRLKSNENLTSDAIVISCSDIVSCLPDIHIKYLISADLASIFSDPRKARRFHFAMVLEKKVANLILVLPMKYYSHISQIFCKIDRFRDSLLNAIAEKVRNIQDLSSSVVLFKLGCFSYDPKSHSASKELKDFRNTRFEMFRKIQRQVDRAAFSSPRLTQYLQHLAQLNG